MSLSALSLLWALASQVGRLACTVFSWIALGVVGRRQEFQGLPIGWRDGALRRGRKAMMADDRGR